MAPVPDLFRTHVVAPPLRVEVDAAPAGFTGAGLTLAWGVHESPLGAAVVGQTERGVCALALVEPAEVEAAVQALAAAWPDARPVEDPTATAPVAALAVGSDEAEAPVRLLLRGTPFQLAVWRALLDLAPGQTATYEDVAARIGQPPGAARAVGTAVGQNAVALLVPCHRVRPKGGGLGGYRWGIARKRALLLREAAA